jgi:uncharacterized protein (TIGR02611 family)
MLLKTARKLVVLVIGSTVLLLGIVMLITPGPAVLVIPAGLAILATEFVWARWLLHKLKAKMRAAAAVLTGPRPPPPPPAP